MWFGNQNNECQCQTTNSKDEKASTSPSIGQSIMPNTKMKLTQKQTNDLKKNESQTQNTGKNEYNTIGNTTPITKTNSTIVPPNNQQSETQSEGSDMQMMPNIENGKSNTQPRQENTEMSELIMNYGSSTELLSKNTNQCLNGSNQDVQFAGHNPLLSNQSNDCTLTTATKQEKSEGYYASTAIKDLENSMIAKYCSNVLLCTCCGKHKRKVLISKIKILSFGLNYQNCRNQIFASLDFSFEGLYQAIRRSYRFGQKNEVNIFLITTDTMSNVKQSIDNKQTQFEIMQDEMSKAINANLNNQLMQTANYDIKEEKNEWYHIKRGDCVQLISELENESVGLSVFSPPFAELYTYSSLS